MRHKFPLIKQDKPKGFYPESSLSWQQARVPDFWNLCLSVSTKNKNGSKILKIRKRLLKILPFFLITFITGSPLSGQWLRVILTSGTYYLDDWDDDYYDYYDYDYSSPIVGFNLEVDFLSICQYFGLGGALFWQIRSYHSSFQDLQTYTLYVHHFWNSRYENDYFMHGPFVGFKKTYLYYEKHYTEEEKEINMVRPLIGYHFSTAPFGVTLAWTQNEAHRSKLEYEFTIKTSYNVVFQIGGSYKGPITGIGSDFHFYSGFEFIW